MTRMLCFRMILFMVLVFAPLSQSWALTIIRDGEPQAVIVLPANPTRQEKSAAIDLQTYLRKMSDVKIEITSEPAGRMEVPIYIGACHAAEARGLADQVSRLKDDGYIIKATSDEMYIIGKDALATRFGVFGLLEDHLGVRWFMPGHIGEAVPQCRDVRIKRMEEVKEPSFRMRWVGTGEWALHNRMNVGVDSELGLHMYSPCRTLHKLCPLEKYFSTHPEYFALVDGERRRYGGERRPQLCTSNPDVIKVVAENACRILEENPELDAITIFPGDDLGFCECDSCKALDDNERISVEDVNNRWPLLGPEKYGVLSRRMAIFYNEVAWRILAEHPDKYVLVGAYSAYLTPPGDLGIETHRNTIVEIARNDCHDLPIAWGLCNLPYSEAIDGWKKTFPNFSVYESYWKLAANELPYPIISSIRKDIPFYHDQGAFGLYTQYSSKNVGTLLLDYYVAAKLLWDVNADVDELLNDFYQKFYGPAWKPMKRYHEALEDAVKYGDVHLPAEYQELSILFDEKVLKDCERYLRQAHQSIKGDPLLKKRVGMAEISFGYVKSAVEYVSDLKGISESLGLQPEALQKARELAEKILRYVEKHGLQNCFKTPVTSYVRQFLNPDFAIRKISCRDGKVRLDKERWAKENAEVAARSVISPSTLLDIWVYGYDFNRDEEKAEHDVYLLDRTGRQVKIGELPTMEGGGDKADRCYIVKDVPSEEFIQDGDTLELQILNPKGDGESSTIYAVYVMPTGPVQSSAEATSTVQDHVDVLRDESFGFVEYCYGGLINKDGQTAKLSVRLHR